MKDIFESEVKVFYWPKYDNLILLNPATFFMFATLEGPSRKRLCVVEDEAVKTHQLVYVGTL